MFREQVAEFELIEIRDRIQAYNGILRAACEKIAPHVSDGMPALLEGAVAEVLDEHYDVLRDVDIAGYEVDPDLIEENLAEVDTGRRRRLVDQALDDLLVSLLLRVKLEVSPELEREVAREVTSLRSR